MSRAQTATEYLIILAVVIVIALIVIGVLGGIPSIGGGASKNAQILVLKNEKVGVNNYYVNSTFAKLKVQNNEPLSGIRITAVSIDGNDCDTNGTISLKVGESKLLTCSGYFEDYSTDKRVPNVKFEYELIDTGAKYLTNGLGSYSNEQCYPGLNEDNWYMICSCSDLSQMNVDKDGDFKLGQDVDCSGVSHTPIAGYFTPFTGRLNGANYEISGLDASLFQSTGSGAEIYNIGLVKLNIDDDATNYGGFIRTLVSGTTTITNSYVKGVINGKESLGGFVGEQEAGSLIIDSCYTDVTINSSSVTGGYSYSGGFVGMHDSSGTLTIKDSHTLGDIWGEGYGVAGLVGSAFSAGFVNISNCYSTSNLESISSPSLVGGLVGMVSGDGLEISNSRFSGKIYGNSADGGLIAFSADYSIINSIWVNQTDDADYCVGGVPPSSYPANPAGCTVS